MRWLLDTNVWIDFHAGQPDASRVFTKARSTTGAWVGFSAMTTLEVLGYSDLPPADDLALRKLLGEFTQVGVDAAVIEESIRIRRAQRLKSPDAIIAATALLQSAKLVTRNTTDFKRVTGLSVLDTQNF